MHTTLGRDARDARTVDERVATVALLTVLDTCVGESTGGTEGRANLNGHGRGGGGCAGKSSAGDLLYAALGGVAADDRGGKSERRVLVQLEGVAGTTVSGLVTRTVHVAGGGPAEGSTVHELVTTVALRSVLDTLSSSATTQNLVASGNKLTSILPSEGTTVSETLGHGHVGRAGRSGREGSARGSLSDTGDSRSGPPRWQGDGLGSQVGRQGRKSRVGHEESERSGSTTDRVGTRALHVALGRGAVKRGTVGKDVTAVTLARVLDTGKSVALGVTEGRARVPSHVRGRVRRVRQGSARSALGNTGGGSGGPASREGRGLSGSGS